MEAIKAIQKLKSRLHNYLVPQSIYMLCDEAIAELEALQQFKNNCDTCKWDDYCGTEESCLSSKYIKDRYEPKLKEQ